MVQSSVHEGYQSRKITGCRGCIYYLASIKEERTGSGMGSIRSSRQCFLEYSQTRWLTETFAGYIFARGPTENDCDCR